MGDSRHCPECGLATWLSLSGNDGLEQSNPRWLRRLALGCGVLAGAQLAGLGALLGMVGIGRLDDTFVVLMLLGCGLYLGICSAGLLLVAGNERRYPDRAGSYRAMVLIGAVVCMLAGGLLGLRATRPIVRGDWLREAPHWWMWTQLGTAIGAAALWAYLGHLSRRAGSRLLRKVSGAMMVLGLIIALSAIPCMRAVVFPEVIRGVQYLPWIYLPATAWMLGVWTVAFAKAARSAGRTWAAESAAGAE